MGWDIGAAPSCAMLKGCAATLQVWGSSLAVLVHHVRPAMCGEALSTLLEKETLGCVHQLYGLGISCSTGVPESACCSSTTLPQLPATVAVVASVAAGVAPLAAFAPTQ